MSNAPTITPTVAAHVLWMFDRGGYPPGTFIQRLLRAWDCADEGNAARLEMAYPEYGAAVNAAQHDPGGIARLQRIAEEGTE
ncbi:hypothetical protein [Streptomyces axinellae]